MRRGACCTGVTKPREVGALPGSEPGTEPGTQAPAPAARTATSEPTAVTGASRRGHYLIQAVLDEPLVAGAQADVLPTLSTARNCTVEVPTVVIFTLEPLVVAP
jgi:hypothetical protein